MPVYAWKLPPRPAPRGKGGAVTKIKLSIRGDIGSRLHFWYSKGKGVACLKFGIKHRFYRKGQWQEKWYSFFAYEELAEYIVQHYSMGSTINILTAEPGGDDFLTKDGRRLQTTVWFIKEIADPHDPQEALAWEGEAVNVTEFVDDEEEDA